MKKPFLYGFQGKARWKTNRVFLVCFAIMFLFDQIGKLKWCIEVAGKIPFFWKCFALATMTVCIFIYSSKIYSRAIYRRTHGVTLLKPHIAWFIMILVAGFTFAIISADYRIFFNISTALLILSCFAFDYYYRRKAEKVEHFKPDAPHEIIQRGK
ncbi:MAG TPA: hypothetical protein VFC85_08790 [Verrucomicrobiae bacterium]|nr:hypothetical protein [Verrucomicrobiae bacterium]